jgi:hypothetical protein
MWLITTLIALVAVVVVYWRAKDLKKYQLDSLALMLGGTFIMVLVDHVIEFMEEGGPFIVTETNGLVPNATMLGVIILIPIFAIWIAMVLVQRQKS